LSDTLEKEVSSKEEENFSNPFESDTKVNSEADEFEKQVNILDPVALSKEVTLTHPETGETKVFIQKELAFIPKTRLLSLVATTLRMASDEDGNVGDVISDTFGGVNELINQGIAPEDAESFAANQFLGVILRLVEIAPDFLDQLYLLVLNVKQKDRQWALTALEVIDDEQGIEILDTAIAQNGDALKNFFDKHLRKVANRVSNVMAEAPEKDTAQE
jgi:hypothetical protein